MKRILICSDNIKLLDSCTSALAKTFQVELISQLPETLASDAVIIDANKIDSDFQILSFINKTSTRCLIVGSDWPEEQQINALTKGVSGYCELSVIPNLLLQAVEQILKGDIWIQRHLVQKVIGSLMQMTNVQKETKPEKSLSEESTKLLESLSNRELDVAKMIQSGKNNKTIASTLHISERTVKAHLTSIFKKLNVPSRLHLAILFKELS